jgi:hypothetical protein
MGGVDDAALQFLTGDKALITVGDYLDRCGLDLTRCGPQIMVAGFRDANELVVRKSQHTKLRELFVALEPELLKLALVERQTLLAYLDYEHIDQPDTAVVDIGWHGSMQEALQALVHQTNPTLPGYYLGLHSDTTASKQTPKQAYLREKDLADYGLYHRSLRRSVELVEMLLSEPVGTVLRLQQSGQKFVPVRSQNQLPSPHLQQIKLLHKTVLDTIRPSRLGKPQAMKQMEKLLNRPTHAEASALGDLVHYEGISDIGRTAPIAKPPHDMPYYQNHPQQLVLDWHGSYWPRGFKARLRGN